MRPAKSAMAATVLFEATVGTADTATMVLKAEALKGCEQEPAGMSFYLFVLYLVLLHVAVAWMILMPYYDRWVEKKFLASEAVDLSFITTTIEELKGVCRAKGLKVFGRKHELLSRLVLAPGFVQEQELRMLQVLHQKLEKGGMVVRLCDVLASDAALKLIEQWEKHKVA